MEAVYVVRTERGRLLGSFRERGPIEASARMMGHKLVWESMFVGHVVTLDEAVFAVVELTPLYDREVEL
jgi:hypothetical protein